MSKAVLISIRPKWCEKIINGVKTVEVRKSRPKLEPPFKCYIYCTRPRFPHEDHMTFFDRRECFYAGGLVVGEFVCNEFTPYCNARPVRNVEDIERRSCLSRKEIWEYEPNGNPIGWHISDLVIYDAPKELNEFERPCKCVGEYEGEWYCDCLNCDDAGDSDYGVIACDRSLKRPPQSWCYVDGK